MDLLGLIAGFAKELQAWNATLDGNSNDRVCCFVSGGQQTHNSSLDVNYRRPTATAKRVMPRMRNRKAELEVLLAGCKVLKARIDGHIRNEYVLVVTLVPDSTREGKR